MHLFTGNILFDAQKGAEEGWLLVQSDTIIHCGVGMVPTHIIAADPNIQHHKIAPGHALLPGLIDAHCHLGMLGEALLFRVSLHDCHSVDDIRRVLMDDAKASAHRSLTPWIIGVGWDQIKLGLPDDRLLTRHDIDTICPDRPVLLYRHCLHVATLNTYGLKLLGLIPDETIEAKLDDPLHTVFLETIRSNPNLLPHDYSNSPTGLVLELACFQLHHLIYSSLPISLKQSFFTTSFETCLRFGLTSVQSNDFFNAWEVYRSLVSTNKVPIRVFMTLPFNEIKNDQDVFECEGPIPDDQMGMVSCHRVKLFADGSLGAETAALRKCYRHHTHCGVLIDSPTVLHEKMKVATEQGWRLEIHAIGDRAAQVVLDGMKEAGITHDHRLILTHCQILAEDLIGRMKEAGVVANVQPSFVTSDAETIESHISDPEILKYAYAWKTLLDQGVYVAGGSDAPVETNNPFVGMHAAMYRTFPCPSSMTCFAPHECLPFHEALRMYTTTAAYAAGEEYRLGALKPGYKADFILVDRSFSDVSREGLRDLWRVQVLATWVGGQCRYKASE